MNLLATFQSWPVGLQTVLLLLASNIFMQEVITLTVFLPFAMLYLKEPFKLDYVWAALCMVGAVYFIFRSA